jgi:hypothetical protein
MTAKTTPTKTREQELADLLTQHRGVLADLEQQAAAWDQAAVELDARAEAKIANFDGPITELPKGVDEDRAKAQLKRQGAADFRRRAQIYAAKVGIETMAAEHDQLGADRIAHAKFNAATIEAEALSIEFEERLAWSYKTRLETQANEARLVEVRDRLTTLASSAGPAPAVNQLNGALVDDPENKPRPGVRVPIDIERVTALPRQVAAAVAERIRALAFDPTDAWRSDLPIVDELQLPEALRSLRVRPASVSATDQRLTEAPPPAAPPARNEDGTLVGAHVQDPFGSRHAIMPRTEAQERAARRQVAADIAAEDISRERVTQEA